MDEIEERILNAWEQVKPHLLEDPAELERRLARRSKPALSRPPRAWCLAVRASDRRLAAYGYDASCSRRARSPLDTPQTIADTAAEAAGYTQTGQSVFLDFNILHDLCRPIKIPWGGDSWDAVAKSLGVGFTGLIHARLSGKVRTDHVRGLEGRIGPPVPMLSCNQALDPNAREFATPDAAWGASGSYNHKRIPFDFQQCLTRVPVYHRRVARRHYDDTMHPEVRQSPPKTPRPRLPPPEPDYVWYKWSKSGEYLGDNPKYWRKSPQDPGTPPPEALVKRKRKRKPRERLMRGSLVFRGWMWVCPQCGKKTRILFLPLKPLSLINDVLEDSTNGQGDNEMGGQGERTGRDHFLRVPLSPCPRVSAPSSFACYSCHRIRCFSRIDRKNSWNELVSYLSGGLLYGREVERPDWFMRGAQRKRGFRPRERTAPRRQQVLRRMLNGWTIKQIAADLKMCKQQVCDCIRKLCRQEGVKNRRELALKLGSPHFQPMDSDRKKMLSHRWGTDEHR